MAPGAQCADALQFELRRVNRSCMTFLVRQAFAKQFGRSPADLDMHLVYDVSHNIAKVPAQPWHPVSALPSIGRAVVS